MACMEQPSSFCGRAGNKLAFALEHFQVTVASWACADFGCNVGGFVDCLLQAGAHKVFAVDTGYGALDWKLRNDERVIVMERTNAMHVELPEAMDLITIDVAWTRQHKILPNAQASLKSGGLILSLLKTQYEAERKELRRGKLLEELEVTVLERCLERVRALEGLELIGSVKSPLIGQKGGNIEYWLLLQLKNINA